MKTTGELSIFSFSVIECLFDLDFFFFFLKSN
jgi:hypothetical protein